MHRYRNCGPNDRQQGRGRAFFASRGGRGFSFGPDGFHFEFDGPGDGRGRGGGGPRGRRRMFESGELRLVLLKLLADQPRHGYELIKAIEELTEGHYAPSPGVVYPTLTLLEDMGQIAEAKSDDSKKVYEATAEGHAYLAENEAEVADLIDRLEGHGQRRRKGNRPEIGRAIGNLMTAMKNRVSQDGWNEELLNEVVDILDDAAKRIERIKPADGEAN